MTPMMTKILCDAIKLADTGQTGYRIQQAHYQKFHGMRRMVKRLTSQGLVMADQADDSDLVLVPTRKARDLVADQCKGVRVA